MIENGIIKLEFELNNDNLKLNKIMILIFN